MKVADTVYLTVCGGTPRDVFHRRDPVVFDRKDPKGKRGQWRVTAVTATEMEVTLFPVVRIKRIEKRHPRQRALRK